MRRSAANELTHDAPDVVAASQARPATRDTPARTDAALPARPAFVLQTYRCVDQIRRLVATLRRGCPDALIVISHNGPEQLPELAAVEGVGRVLPAVPGRGRFALVDGFLSALRWLRRQPEPYDWVVLLSGQDYPVRSLRELAGTLGASSYDGYFHHFDPLDPAQASAGPMVWPPHEAEDRYQFRYGFVWDEPSRLQRAVLRVPRLLLARSRRFRLTTSYGIGVGVRPADSVFSPSFRLYGGSYWSIVRRRCAEALLDFVDEEPRIVDHFRHTVLPDEAFAPTVLLNRGFRISRDGLRYFDFRNLHHGAARTLHRSDLDAVLASGAFFARKFDLAADPALFDALDDRALA